MNLRKIGITAVLALIIISPLSASSPFDTSTLVIDANADSVVVGQVYDDDESSLDELQRALALLAATRAKYSTLAKLMTASPSRFMKNGSLDTVKSQVVQIRLKLIELTNRLLKIYIKLDPAIRPPLPPGLSLPGSSTTAGGSTTTTPTTNTQSPAGKPINIGGKVTSKSPQFKSWLANGTQIAKGWNFPSVTNMYGEKVTQEAFLKSIIYIESNGVHQKTNGQIITSSCGALGFMQLMPNTAKGLGVNPRDPKQNIAGGAKFLGNIFNKGKVAGKPSLDKLIMAGCAYNCGPYSKRLDQSWSSFVKDSKAPKETRRYGLKLKMCLGIKLTSQEKIVAKQLFVPKSQNIDQYARNIYSYAKGIGQ
ncbi:MAG: hypothetical protein A2W80_05150 [Candidatus Riflebacteria bacterium GWC2_50_8]|nr:MAG: hypothetical protein A2W80_05150 [Candidatus Riflebacteria bacterium GWC2_50_8]